MTDPTYDWEAAWEKPATYNWNDAWNKKKTRPDGPPAGIVPPATVNGASSYGAKALADELHILANTGPDSHKRNDQLNESAFSLAQLVAAGHLPDQATRQELYRTGVAIGLTPSETRNTIHSGFAAGLQQPRVVAPLETGANVTEVPEITIMRETEPDQTAAQTRFDQLLLQTLDRDELRNIQPPEPLIENWLSKSSLAWIQGKWGNAKTFAAVDIACCVATGTTWHGHLVTQGTVLYLIAEGASGLNQRVDAWEEANGQKADRIKFLPMPVQLGDPAHIDVTAFRMLLNHFQPVLVIIDTQARVTVGCEENSSKDMGVFVDVLDGLKRQSKACMLVVHHEPRNGDNLRGSVALEGGADHIIRSSKDGDNVTISSPKQKDSAEPGDIHLTLQPVGNSAVLSHDVSRQDKPVSPNEQKILEVMEEWPGEASATELRKACGDIPEQSYYRSLNKLVNKGKVLLRKEGRSKFYSFSPVQPQLQGMA
jgi:AAA domain